MKQILDKLRALIAKASSLGRRIVDPFPLTPLGIIVLAGSGTALYVLGIKRVDLVVLAMSAVALGVAGLSVLAVSMTALLLKFAITKSLRSPKATLCLECGFPTRVGFSVSSLWWVPFVNVTWSWLSPIADVRTVRERRRLHEESTPVRRGLYDEIVRRIEVSDPFGIARCAFRVRERRAVRALPSVGALKRVDVVRTLAPGEEIDNPKGGPDGERTDMRAYNPGDPIKFVLWKVFARTGELVLRAPERAFSPAKQTTAYLVTGVGDEAAAGVARLLVETHSLGSKWVLGADGSDEDARGPQQAMELIARSGATKREDGALGLRGFLQRHATAGGRIVVIVPATPGPWLDRVKSAVAQAGVSGVEFIVCLDGVAPVRTRSKLARWFVEEPPREKDLMAGDPLPTQEDLRRVCAALAGQSQRGSVMIVDRRAGRVYGDAHRKALEVAA